MTPAELYRENLREANRALEVATTVKDDFKARGLIEWGMTKRKEPFVGWLVKGPGADAAYSAWHKAQSDVEHWGNLLAAELRTPTPAERPTRAPSMTVDEVEARKRELAEQVAARLGEKPEPEDEGEVPF